MYRPENVENESVGMVFRFGALDGLVKVRDRNLPAASMRSTP